MEARRVTLFLGALTLLGIVLAGALFAYGRYFKPPLGPAQPFAFSHRLHVERKIDCQYCHQYAAKSLVAGIPSAETCVQCHRVVARDKPNVQSLLTAWEKQDQEAFTWNRIYQLWDTVYFPHRAHIKKEIACATCHGDVGSMEVTFRAVDQNMGWCLSCHREKGAGTDCWTCHE